jgi:hypothetical protein
LSATTSPTKTSTGQRTRPAGDRTNSTPSDYPIPRRSLSTEPPRTAPGQPTDEKERGSQVSRDTYLRAGAAVAGAMLPTGEGKWRDKGTWMTGQGRPEIRRRADGE